VFRPVTNNRTGEFDRPDELLAALVVLVVGAIGAMGDPESKGTAEQAGERLAHGLGRRADRRIDCAASFIGNVRGRLGRLRPGWLD
jgi:hypothetical protein